MLGVDLARAHVCSVCVDAEVSPVWLRVVLERIQSGCNSIRVFPILLPGAATALAAEFWPQWDWIDFREPEGHEANFQRMLMAILGARPDAASSIGDEGLDTPHLGEYERRIRRLERFRSIGLREDVYMESQRKIITRWLDDPHWEDS